ncbi:MAG: hypothetical protein K1X74_19805 [Pirellulales bacterium]|nr:hypothetical protein [Pirellulales bacterium]
MTKKAAAKTKKSAADAETPDKPLEPQAEPAQLWQYWRIATNTFYARIAAGIILCVFVLLAFRELFNAHQSPNNTDASTGEALFQFFVEVGIPTGIYFALIFRLAAKTPRKAKFHNLAPFFVLLVLLASWWTLCQVSWLCDGIKVLVDVPIDDYHTQKQYATRPLRDGIDQLCQYSAPVFAFLLSLDVIGATSNGRP